jgi:hypothetical protein
LFNTPADKFQFQCASVFCMVYIGYSLFAFHRLLNNKYSAEAETNHRLAVTTAIYVYSSGGCLLFLFATAVDIKFLLLLWSTFFITLNIFHYIMIGIALYRKPLHGG